ncbi:multidrug efflux RND transporter permease subunit [Curvibacter sp. HBC28]|uniref:Efflux pump membrane transporter n=1 Tax=Curvibacter microcysteis TaxID=3026419 RepID=A0ABT5MEK0_9BURK|nr:multidrug efflux RND transporter permease subunit [Curvibacter sp. HBC28]MDD0815007.1 multidrug efflux RND transporter permease subunit [Curvibacter sp. HBC28]
MSSFFIGRPKLAWVVAIFITLAGLLAIPSLPVSQFPVVAPPQITVTATYPGASASAVVNSVTSILEEELNGARGLLYFDSSSSNSSAEITATFKPGTDPALAQVDVQNRLKKAEARLPAAVTRQGVQVEQANASFLLIYALNFKGEDEGKDVVALADYAARTLNNEIRRVPGVGKLQLFGSEAAMRVWVSPQKLLGYGLTVADVNSAIAAQNVQVPAGSFGSRPGTAAQELSATLAVKGMLESPEEFGRIVLRANRDGSTVRLSDVARLEIGRQDYSAESRQNGKKAVAGAVQLAPGANAIQTADAVKARLRELAAQMPSDMEYSIAYDTSLFVKVAIEKVIHTLLEAVVLVFLVMFLFLQNVRYTLIPTIVVPVCLMGTFAVMWGLDFSVNMMTMFGLVLAIGILVDDAIVVVENVERIMAEEGLSPKDATRKAMTQVSGAIIGITLVLVAVFLPLAFMTGSVGVIYRQFSLSLAVSILFSGFLALTLTPALCATLLQPPKRGVHAEQQGFFGGFNRVLMRLTHRFESLNVRLLRRTGRAMGVYLLAVALLGWLYVRVPESFVPPEDQGYWMVDMQLPPGATYPRTEALVKQVDQYLMSREGMDSAFSILGFSFSGMGQNAALGFPSLKDWPQRPRGQTVESEIAAFNERFGQLPDGTAMAVMPPPIEGLGNAGGFALRLQDRAGLGRAALTQARDQLLAQASASPLLAYAVMEGLQDAPQLRLDVDRSKAEALGVGFENIATTLSTAFGSALVNDFANAGRLQRVIVQADAQERMTPESLMALHVPGRNGAQVPLSAFVTAAWEMGPVQISRYNGYPAYRIMGDAAPGHSTGEAMAEIERMLATLPKGIGHEWTALSYQERFAGQQAPFLFVLAVVVVFLLLVALYESWTLPASVMLIVPLGALGSVAAVSLLGLTNDVYFKVGLITIIGLSAKNAILIVEFAKALREQGHPLVEAACMAARLRFRPIVMTSMAFILGVLPLALAQGAGAASQRSLGTGVIGGMVSATVLGVVFAPVFYVWVMGLFKSKAPDETAPPQA